MNNEFFVDEDLIYRMKSGDEKSIYMGLIRNGATYRTNAIIQTVKHKILKSNIIFKIRELKSDNIRLMGVYRVSDFAVAALDLLGVEKYFGDDEIILKLIDSNFEF